jgi:hypothetical protein
MHVNFPCGSGIVQFCVVPSCVMTTFAVAEPSYVTTSRREDDVGDCPVMVTVAAIARMTVPAVGYGCSFVVVAAGMTTAVTVSPVVRFAVNAPSFDLPVLDSVAADVPLTVRFVLPGARPATVWLLVSFTVLVLLSRRVVVPATVTFVLTVFVVLSSFGCAPPAVVRYCETRVTVNPSCVVGPQVTTPLA